VLRFSEANAKTKKLMSLPELRQYLQGKRKVYSLDLLSGWACPAAQDCFAKVYVENGKRRLEDGPLTQFRCFSASQEVAYPNVYNLRKFNFEILRSIRGYRKIAEVICDSIPKKAGVIRIHVAGDFFNLDYLRGMVLASELRQDVLFYAYTKAINLLAQIDMNAPSIGVVRPNFLITASLGGKYDNLISEVGLRTAKVVFSEAEAWDLPIDHNDSHAATPGGDFCLLLHGVQPKGSKAAKALKVLKGNGSYSR
jgi:hypothetical protein